MALAAALLALLPSAAAAEPEGVKSGCVRAYESSQVLRQQGHHLEAREALRVCAREECPVLVRTDCANWLVDLEEALPSIVVHATTDGVERNDVTVLVDGKVVKNGLDGKAISIDPGPHALRYVVPGFAPLEATVVVREGEHFRPLVAAFKSPEIPVAPPAPTARPVPLAAWILAGVSLVAAGSFAGFAIAGTERRDALERQCAPFCASSDVDGVQRQYFAADVSLAAAAASLGLASYVYLTRPRVPLKVGAMGLGGPLGFALCVSGDL